MDYYNGLKVASSFADFSNYVYLCLNNNRTYKKQENNFCGIFYQNYYDYVFNNEKYLFDHLELLPLNS